jgi:ribosomal protein S18 acetylase RimI-like enzyme
VSGHPLDNAAWGSLTGPHAGLAVRVGDAARYPTDVAPFAALPDCPTREAWRDLAGVADGGGVVLFRAPVEPAAGWREEWGGVGVQMVWEGGPVADAAQDDTVALTLDDATGALSLVRDTNPGPFAARTLVLGRYLAIRDPDTGALVAMAGERLHPEGFREVSAVCTAASWRGRGLATRLVLAVVAGITGRGETPFLHAASDNVAAIRLYTAIGFAVRREVRFSRLRAPSQGARPNS